MNSKKMPILLCFFLLASSVMFFNAEKVLGSKELRDVIIDKKVEELLDSMTLEEKIDQMVGAGLHNIMATSPNERLGIPPFNFTDGPHGVSKRFGNATAFPVSIALGATWDPSLSKEAGRAIAKEARAKGRNVLLAPCVNLVMDPRAGRSQEGFGEDPFLTSEMGVAFIKGVQGEQVIAVPKHFACNNIEENRFTCNVELDERTLREVYLPHFKSCIAKGEAAGIMSAYNRVRDRYCSSNEYLLKDILREEWGFDGFVVTDWFAFGSTTNAIKAGLNVQMPFPWYYNPSRIKSSIRRGDISEDDLDQIVGEILRVKFEFGLFEDREAYSGACVECEEHVNLAREIALKGLVLLKNDGLLPLDKSEIDSISVIGEATDEPRLGDHGSSWVMPSYCVTPLEGIREEAGDKIQIHYCVGTDITEAKKLASETDVAIVVAGLNYKDEGEGEDREELTLPRRQPELIREVGKVNENLVVILIGGSAISMGDWIDNAQAVLMAWYPGQEGGSAIADALFGIYSPGGKLPLTFPDSIEQLPPFENSLVKSLWKDTEYSYYHGYRYFDKNNIEPLFPFGYGLSYTQFEYSNLTIDKKKILPTEELSMTFDIKNIGNMKGDEVAQLFLSYPCTETERFEKELRGFKRITLDPGEKKAITFKLQPEQLSFFSPDSGWKVEMGKHRVKIGSSSQDIRLEEGFEALREIETKPQPRPALPKFAPPLILALILIVAFFLILWASKKIKIKNKKINKK